MIKGPKNAIPTLKGWTSPKGELLKSQRITQDQIDEWYGVAEPAPVVEEVADVVYGSLNEAPSNNKSLEDMTTSELLAISEQYGIEFASARPSRRVIIEKLNGVI